MNLYAYVNNDPLNATDPSGLWSPAPHQRILQYAFEKRLPATEIRILQQGSQSIDDSSATSSSLSYMHSMRSPGQSPEDAVRARDQFIEDRLGIARAMAQFGNREGALNMLGQALHPIMDASSWMHTDERGQPKEFNLLSPEAYWHSPDDRWGGETSYSLTRQILDQQRRVLNDAYNKVFK